MSDPTAPPPPNTKDTQVSMRLPGALKARFETDAVMTGRSKSHVAMAVLTDDLDWRLPQVADLQTAVAASDRGEFASADEAKAVFDRFTVPRPA